MSDNNGGSVVNVSLPGIGTILTVIFVIFKLLGVIAWSWWIVFLPLIISAGLTALVVGIALLIAFIAYNN